MPRKQIDFGINTGSGRLQVGRAPPCPKTLARLVLLLSMAATTTHAHPILGSFDRVFYWTEAQSVTSNDAISECWKCASRYDCAWGMMGECPISIPAGVYFLEKLWEGILVFAATFEVLARGFTLGFGIRMLKYLFCEPENTNENSERAVLFNSYRRKVLISMVAGMSLAAFLHGSSIFFPARWREEWFSFVEFDRKDQSSIPDTNLPLVLYQYIRRSVEARFKDKMGNLRLSCDDSTNIQFSIDWSTYVWERSETGLKYLWTTLEVLLRGFFLGFGAQMLKFLFFPLHYNRDTDFSRMADDDFGLLMKSLKHRLFVSAVSGISVAAIFHGSSLFVPTQLRDQWLVFT